MPHFFAMSLLPGERVFEARNDADYSGFDDPTQLRLAAAYESGLAKWLWQTAGGGSSPFRIIWANGVAAQDPRQAAEPLAEHFVGRGLCIWRTGWETGDVMFSVEAGPYYPRHPQPGGRGALHALRAGAALGDRLRLRQQPPPRRPGLYDGA